MIHINYQKNSMKKIKPLIKNIRIKLERVAKDFDIYYNKIKEHIKLTKIGKWYNENKTVQKKTIECF